MARRTTNRSAPEQLVAFACLAYLHKVVLTPKSSGSTTSSDCSFPGDDDDRFDHFDSSHFPFVQNDDDDSFNTKAADNMEDSRLSLLELVQSDIELAQQSEQEQHKLAQQLLVTLGALLRDADRELTSLQDNNLLGSAIVRSCKEIADVVSTIAENLQQEQSSDSLAAASLQDFGDCTDLRLQPVLDNDQLMGPRTVNETQQMAILVDLLNDIEFSLRAVEQEEAEEIADLAVSVALVFVQSLKHAHSQLTPSDLLLPPSSEYNASRRIERLDDDEEAEAFDVENPPPPSPLSRAVPRVRCLWPPLAPKASEFLQWTKEELFHRQHWAVSTLATLALWPVALTAAMWSVPALTVDHLLQQTYENFDESPVIVGAEVGAAQLQRTAILSYKMAVALAKPSLRVARRQVQKHGPGLLAAAQEKARHPVSTLQEAANGTVWCTSQLLSFCGEQWQRLQRDNSSEALL